jgi:hypothetical protein
MSDRKITQEEITNTRRKGFANSNLHMEEERRRKLHDSYIPQDTRRTANVNNFISGVRGTK